MTPPASPPSPAARPPVPWQVVVPLPVPALEYAAPHGYGGAVPVGCRVLVPWRGELTVALVVGGGEGRGSHRLREAVHLLDDEEGPWVPPATVQAITTWARDARLPAGLVWGDLLGVGWSVKLDHRVRAVPGADLGAFARHVPTSTWTDAAGFAPALLDAVREQGLLEEAFRPVTRTRGMVRARPLSVVPAAARTVTVLRAAPEAPSLTPKGQVAWAWLEQHGPQDTLSGWARGAGVSAGVVTNVLNAGGAQYVPEEAPPPPAWTWLRDNGPVESLSAWANGAAAGGVPLSPTLAAGLAARGWADTVQEPAPPPPLPEPAPPWTTSDPDRLPEAPAWRLHGGRPTSRFRTLGPRVARLLSQGRGVLVLAPDHATLRRAWEGLSGLAAGAGTRAVQVSGALGEVQRDHAWNLIRLGEARLVIGSYLALTAPLPDPALVIVLEEGSDAYKLPAGSHAFIPDVAARVAAAHDAALALVGSAPAAESVPLPGAVLPPPRARVHVVDYAHPPEQPELGPLSSVHLTPGDLGYPLSHDLARLLRQVQERGRQAALLAPRRGYSALLRCPSCEHTPQCCNCDVPLRFHQETRQLTCHQCGYHQAIPDRCDECGERMWKARGPGTEWIAAEVAKLTPGLPVYRCDRDRQDDLAPLHAGESGVVVGTQLLLAQDAPPNLALIGVTLADTWLNVSDFRASERYHRLLRQLAEWHPDRAPLIVVQTFQADHPALKVLVEGRDALAYPAAEERARAALGYPPHARLAQVEVAARDPQKAKIAAQEVFDALHGAGATAAEVLGPAPSPVARLRGVYPYHLLLRARDDTRLAQLLATLDRSWKARVRVDVNPRGGL
ncbi:primosomal protein N' [Deinococcus metallilatus]|uniref:Probable replication restart protein PriA n=1 Tax=Deinococcus metallilatus TaxID=1211322 RepID=A0AAJ5F7E5_9DEIO|nr:primosomal protein N' [Deinococcus metallilatus]MBB5296342.1 primosomal protein N' (replication factor Y) [Deinococcus metallilatus]QBY09979.1 primosomal protein N' [Deinococcus metallilatus]RXJ08703.1 primosomal protein N' [Deinococcus metallilatus]TLK25177.1 primosomal protein N' [Deinococcus metallilatus]GMA14744.1 primosomal protein n', putative [Deinococcus metallilatus]